VRKQAKAQGLTGTSPWERILSAIGTRGDEKYNTIKQEKKSAQELWQVNGGGEGDLSGKRLTLRNLKSQPGREKGKTIS